MFLTVSRPNIKNMVNDVNHMCQMTISGLYKCKITFRRRSKMIPTPRPQKFILQNINFGRIRTQTHRIISFTTLPTWKNFCIAENEYIILHVDFVETIGSQFLPIELAIQYCILHASTIFIYSQTYIAAFVYVMVMKT